MNVNFKSLTRLLLISIALRAALIPSASGSGIEGWREIRGTTDLIVYEKLKPGSDLVSIRGDGQLNYPPRLIAWILLDRDHRKNWVGQVKEARLLRKIDAHQFVEYTHITSPPLVRDRDFVSLVRVESVSGGQQLMISSEEAFQELSPLPCCVRGRMSDARFVISSGNKPGTTRLQAEINADPKGSIPKWIVNLFQRAWPVKTFAALRTEARRRNELPIPPEFLTLIKDLDGRQRVDENKDSSAEIKNLPKTW